MYKVFFNDRIVLLTDDFIRNFQVRNGLFYKYRSTEDLQELIDFYSKLKKIDTLFIFHHDLDQLQERFKSCFHMVEAAGGLVCNEDGRLLIMKRRGKWDLPKGKVNIGESIPRAALREVSEECGLSNLKIIGPLMATYHCYRLDGEWILKRTSWFDMKATGNEPLVPQSEEDITEVKWVGKDDLREITSNTYWAILDILKYKSLL